MKFRQWLESVSIWNSYWITPKGSIIPVPVTHIDHIVNFPQKYGLTKEYLKQVEQETMDTLSHDGVARDRVMTELMEKGWIRIRRYNRPDVWSINTADFNSRTFEKIIAWVEEMLDLGASWYDEVQLVSITGIDTIRTSFKDLVKQAA